MYCVSNSCFRYAARSSNTVPSVAVYVTAALRTTADEPPAATPAPDGGAGASIAACAAAWTHTHTQTPTHRHPSTPGRPAHDATHATASDTRHAHPRVHPRCAAAPRRPAPTCDTPRLNDCMPPDDDDAPPDEPPRATFSGTGSCATGFTAPSSPSGLHCGRRSDASAAATHHAPGDDARARTTTRAQQQLAGTHARPHHTAARRAHTARRPDAKHTARRPAAKHTVRPPARPPARRQRGAPM